MPKSEIMSGQQSEKSRLTIEQIAQVRVGEAFYQRSDLISAIELFGNALKDLTDPKSKGFGQKALLYIETFLQQHPILYRDFIPFEQRGRMSPKSEQAFLGNVRDSYRIVAKLFKDKPTLFQRLQNEFPYCGFFWRDLHASFITQDAIGNSIPKRLQPKEIVFTLIDASNPMSKNVSQLRKALVDYWLQRVENQKEFVNFRESHHLNSQAIDSLTKNLKSIRGAIPTIFITNEVLGLSLQTVFERELQNEEMPALLKLIANQAEKSQGDRLSAELIHLLVTDSLQYLTYLFTENSQIDAITTFEKNIITLSLYLVEVLFAFMAGDKRYEDSYQDLKLWLNSINETHKKGLLLLISRNAILHFFVRYKQSDEVTGEISTEDDFLIGEIGQTRFNNKLFVPISFAASLIDFFNDPQSTFSKYFGVGEVLTKEDNQDLTSFSNQKERMTAIYFGFLVQSLGDTFLEKLKTKKEMLQTVLDTVSIRTDIEPYPEIPHLITFSEGSFAHWLGFRSVHFIVSTNHSQPVYFLVETDFNNGRFEFDGQLTKQGLVYFDSLSKRNLTEEIVVLLKLVVALSYKDLVEYTQLENARPKKIKRLEVQHEEQTSSEAETEEQFGKAGVSLIPRKKKIVNYESREITYKIESENKDSKLPKAVGSFKKYLRYANEYLDACEQYLNALSAGNSEQTAEAADLVAHFRTKKDKVSEVKLLSVPETMELASIEDPITGELVYLQTWTEAYYSPPLDEETNTIDKIYSRYYRSGKSSSLAFLNEIRKLTLE